jgi:hypothetical protein
LLELHCWFHRNVVFSALIHGTDMAGWKTVLKNFHLPYLPPYVNEVNQKHCAGG